MYNKKKNNVLAICLVVSLLTLTLVATPRANAVYFYIAGWDGKDDYGQGLTTWYAQSNATGTWVSIEAQGYLDADVDPIRWNVSQAIRILVWVALNSTYLGLSSIADGLNYVRHNITITNQFDEIVFSQQNFTYYQNITNGDIYAYQHYVIPDLVPLEGEFYTITLLAEIYY